MIETDRLIAPAAQNVVEEQIERALRPKNLSEYVGQVYREFYYNDAGVQIQTLANSVQARAKGLKPGDAEWPESAYNGDYIAEIAADFLAKKTVKSDDREYTASGDINDLDSIR